MWLRVGAVAGLGWLLSHSTLFAQTLVLPTPRSSTVRTLVLVPDRGGALLGGISGSQNHRQSAGVPGAAGLPGLGRLSRQRAISRGEAAETVSVHVTVIDLAALDQAVLAEAARRRGEVRRPDAAGDLSARYRRETRRISPHDPPRSVADIRQEQAARSR